MILRRFLASLIWFWFACLPAYASPVTFPTGTLDIVTQNATLHYHIEVATTEAQLEYGLMFRKSLPHMHAMLFDFTTPQQVSMWMKNTLIGLDMLFIDNNGTITGISANAVPQSLDIITSPDDQTRAVLEIGAGEAARNHIAKGDKVLYSIFP